ncbi:NAD-binding protein [Enterovibrio baiacu]|uniref:NAD-binding protein n=1 Tax=Enterovibrio baiacu TaxID=2491023 RepID=UPI00138743BB|nr:NAD-binding protein [Enterovibrio baiacu]
MPLTHETLIKLEVLYAGGADVLVTSPSFMEVEPDLLDRFIQAGGRWFDDVPEDAHIDICLDCAGELIGKVRPSIGCVEITGTGTNKYTAANLDYPVISVDMSKVKALEAMLGTGEAFVRAFSELTETTVDNQHFLVMGYGKVGQGIAHHLQPHTSSISVVDKKAEHLALAKQRGFNAIDAADKSLVEAAARESFCIVTATGIESVVSDNYDAREFLHAQYLANMGGEDEFGTGFPAGRVMCDAKPINFFVDSPTLMHYLDPVFYSHNLGVELLSFSRLAPGVHAFPDFIANELVEQWQRLHQEGVHI